VAHILKIKTPKGELRHQVRWKEDRSYRSRNFGTRAEAVEFRATKDLEHPPRRRRVKKKQDATFKSVAEGYLNRKEHPVDTDPLEPQTLRSYRSVLNEHVYPIVGEKQISRVTKDDFEDLLRRSRQIGVSRRTRNEALRLMSVVLQYAVGRDIIDTVPVHTLNTAPTIREKTEARLRQDVKAFTPAEIRALLAACDSLSEDENRQTKRTWLRYRPMVYFLVFTGVRLSEARGFPRNNYLPGENIVKITQAASEDGVKIVKTVAGVRKIPLPPTLHEVMEPWLASHDRTLVFGTATNNPVSAPTLYPRLLEPLRDRADALGTPVDRTKTFHAFRHHYASMIVRRGANLKQLCSFLGHSNPAFTLKTYAHLFDEDTAEFANKIEV